MKKDNLFKIGLIIFILLVVISICGCSGIEANTINSKKETITIKAGNFEEYFNINISVDSCNIEKYEALGIPGYRADGQMTITITPFEDLEVENLVVELSFSDSVTWDIEGADEIGHMELMLPSNGCLTKTIYCNGDGAVIRPEYLTGKYSVTGNTSGTIKI